MVAYIATGITVTLSGLSGELLDVDHGGESCDTEDTTHQLSTDGWREFMIGLKDGGEVTLTIAFGSGSHITLASTGDGAAEANELLITFPGTKTLTAQAFITGHSLGASLGTKIVQDVTVKITGKPTWA